MSSSYIHIFALNTNLQPSIIYYNASLKQVYKLHNICIQPPLVDTRMALIEEAYNKLDADGTGIIAAAALRDNLNCEFHPMLAAGEWGPEDVMEKYIDSMTGGREEVRCPV